MFLSLVDLDATIYPEIVQMMSRYTDTVITMNLNAAEGDLTLFLATRYDIRAELEKTGDNRNPYLLLLARDLAIYHLYSLQETIPAHRVKRYDQAIAMLKMIQDGKSTLPGVDPAPVSETPVVSGQISYGGNLARATLQNPLKYGVSSSPLPSNVGYT